MKLPLATILACGLASAALGQAGAPMRTDDPRTPGEGNFELNLAFDYEQLTSESTFRAPILDFNYGLGERVQLNAQLPWLHIDHEENPVDRTLGRTEAGAKIRYLGDAVAGVSMSVFPRLAFDTPGGDPDHEEGLALRLPAQAAWQAERLGLVAEFGYEFVESAEDAWTAGIATEYALDGIALLAELHADFDESLGNGTGIANFGLNLPVGGSNAILLAYGRGVDLGAESELEWAAYAAWQFRF